MIQEKKVGWKFYRPKCLSGSVIGLEEKLSHGLFVQLDLAHLWNILYVKWVRFQMTTSVFWPYKFDFIIYDLKLRKKQKISSPHEESNPGLWGERPETKPLSHRGFHILLYCKMFEYQFI